MTKKERLQLLITGKTPKMLEGFKAFDSGVAELKKNLEETIRVSTLDEVGGKLNELRKKLDFTAIQDAVTNLKTEIEDNDVRDRADLETRLSSLKKELVDTDSTNSNSIKDLAEQIQGIETQIADILSRKPIEVPDFTPQIIKVENTLRDLITKSAEQDKIDDKEVQQQITDLEESLKKVRAELIDRLNAKGGGSMNRQIYINGVDPLTMFTDINLKAGTNVTITYATNNTTKKVDVTLSASGGGGGTVRSITSISANTVAGNTPGTDYVFICSGTINLTLPTASANQNQYTVKNAGTGVITILPNGADTLDNDVSIIMPVRYTSVDLISDTVSNWNIT